MNTKFTNGIWQVFRCATGKTEKTHLKIMSVITIPTTPVIREVVEICKIISKNESDTKLIAAAPEMLESLQSVLNHWNSGNFNRDPAIFSQIESVIRKAT